MENMLTPFYAVEGLPGKRVLVLAPHPDDEVFGCGGTLARMSFAGARVRVIVATDGSARAADPEYAATVRENESRDAAITLGLETPVFWRLPDRSLIYDEYFVSRIEDAISEWQADLVLAPSAFEVHPDHYALALGAAEAVRRNPNGLSIAFYEVGCALRPNILVDITPVLDKKSAAMACFQSELRFQPYDQQIAALNRYRSYSLPRDIVAAEAFMLIEGRVLAKDWLVIFSPEVHLRRELGLLVTSLSDEPLVSVLVRSMDRQTLGDALDSVAVQTWRNLELVVVASIPEHKSLSNHWRGRHLRFVPASNPLSRPAAANVALLAAKGNYCLFLDDDDLIAPDHISRLVAALAGNSVARVAYAGVEAVDAANSPICVFDAPFNAARLMEENFMPIHAVLFDRALFEVGCRFDESLDVYEDWDFWLQLVRHTSFEHVAGVSATYRMGGTSAVGLAASTERQGNARRRIYEKWRSKFDAASFDSLFLYHKKLQEIARDRTLEMDGQLADARQQLADAHQQLADAHQQLADAHQQLADAHQQLADAHQAVENIMASTSWRMTAPLRRVAKATKCLLAYMRNIHLRKL